MYFVETAKFLEDFAPHHQAGGGNSAKILRQMLASEVTGFMASNTVNVTSDATNSENDTAVLKGPVRIPQSCAHDADPWAGNLRHKFAQTIRVHDFNIIVEKEKDRSAGAAGSEIDQAAKIKIAGTLDNLNSSILPQAAVQFTCLLLHAVVLENNYLEIRVVAFVQNAIDTLLHQRRLVARWNDDGNDRPRFGQRIANALVNLEFAWFHFCCDVLCIQMFL